MDEHDDDLESEVIEGAEKESDAFPDTRDELDGTSDVPEEEGGFEIPDGDAAEL